MSISRVAVRAAFRHHASVEKSPEEAAAAAATHDWKDISNTEGPDGRYGPRTSECTQCGLVYEGQPGFETPDSWLWMEPCNKGQWEQPDPSFAF